MGKIEWDELEIPQESAGTVDWTEQEQACIDAGGHRYLMNITEGSATIFCQGCNHDPTDGYIENISTGDIPVTVKIEVIHYPANPSHADEYDVFYETEIDIDRLIQAKGLV
jgi:hypothetical protein